MKQSNTTTRYILKAKQLGWNTSELERLYDKATGCTASPALRRNYALMLRALRLFMAW